MMKCNRIVFAILLAALLALVALVACGGEGGAPSSVDSPSAPVPATESPGEGGQSGDTGENTQSAPAGSAAGGSRAPVAGQQTPVYELYKPPPVDQVVADPVFNDQWAELLSDLSDEYGPAKAIEMMETVEGDIPGKLIRSFLDYHEELCYSLYVPYPENITGKLQSEDVAHALGMTAQEYHDNCYDFWTSEGYLMLLTDTQALRMALEDRLDPESDEYLALLHDYPVTALVSDAGLIRTWNQTAEHISAYYDFTLSRPDGVFTDEALANFSWGYQLYIGAIRLDNTPFDAGGSLDPVLRQSYVDFLDKHSDEYPPAEDIRLLYSMWVSKDFRADDDIYALIRQLALQYPVE